jgi:hypothetical protein
MTTTAPSDRDVLLQRPTRDVPVPGSARRAFLVALCALLLAALVNGAELERTARRQPLGWKRDALVRVASAVHGAGDALRLTSIRHGVEMATDRSPGGAGESQASAARAGAMPSGGLARRTPTKQRPLRLWIGGDSVMQVLGESLVAMADRSGVVAPTLEFHISTGLARPDYYDWPARLQEVVDSQHPEVAVVLYGAHDAQPMEVNGTRVAFGTAAWIAEYRARVDAAMTTLSADGRLVYWLGQPVMRSAALSDRIARMNEVYRSEAARHPGVVYVDTWSSTVDSSGGYSSYLPGSDGQPVLARAADGVHLERAGGDILARLVLSRLAQDWPVRQLR